MPDLQRVRDEVRGIVADIADLPVERVSADAKLADLDVDSLRGLRIVAEVERRYGIVIPDAEVGTIRSMADIFSLIDRHGTRE